MRRPLLFLAALGIGALSVQATDGDAALLRSVEELTGALRRRADRAVRPEPRLETRVYRIRDLAAAVPEPALSEAVLRGSRECVPPPRRPSPGPGFDAETVMDWTIAGVSPRDMPGPAGAFVQAVGRTLIVRTVPALHERIGEFLARLRALHAASFRVGIVAVRETDGVDDARALLARPRLGTWLLRGLDGQSVLVRTGTEWRYLQSYEVELAQASAIGDPGMRPVFAGTLVGVRCGLAPDREEAVIDLTLERTAVDRPIRRVETEHGPLELPRQSVTRLRTTCRLPLDEPVLVARADGIDFVVTVGPGAD